MKISINKEDILKSVGLEFTNIEDYLLYMQELIDYLYFHNKNYTNKQYFKIEELRAILNNIEMEEK